MKSQLRTPPGIEPTQEWLDRNSTFLAREVQLASVDRSPRRVRVKLVAIATTAALLVTSVALAAVATNPISWLRSAGPGEARYSVDATRTVAEPASSTLTCQDPVGVELGCVAGDGPGRLVYDFYHRVRAEPAFTRQSALTALEQAERRGLISSRKSAEVRAQISEVSDEFFMDVNVLFGLSSIASPHIVREGVVLVPPADMAQFVTCRSQGEGFRCANLAATANVPIGSPIYGLRESDDWVERPYDPVHPWPTALVEDLFGRDLKPAEVRLLMQMQTSGTGESGAGSEEIETATTPSDE